MVVECCNSQLAKDDLQPNRLVTKPVLTRVDALERSCMIRMPKPELVMHFIIIFQILVQDARRCAGGMLKEITI